MTETLARPTAAVVIFRAMAAACRPRARRTVSEWADEHRVLSAVASGEAGRWRTSRAPFLREIMDALSLHSPVRRVVVMKCSQIGVTEVALNWLGYIMDHAPAPTLFIEPTLDLRDKIEKTRLKPMIEETPALRELLGERKTRDGSNTQDLKLFPGGVLILGGANSAASLRQMSIRYVILDEADAFPWDVGGEGDPAGLIDVRQTTFPRRKTLEISTPTIKDASRIEEDHDHGDRRKYFVPCPHCGAWIVLKWKQLQWTRSPDGVVTAAWYVCEHCGAEINESHKPAMLAAGRWRPTAKPRVRGWRSYHINALYYPVGLGLTWMELAQEWLDSQSDPAKLKRFINTRLAECWEDRSRDLKPQVIRQRAEEYKCGEIPPGCLVLTAGIDTQDDRLAIQVLGWGREERCWVIDWLELPGDPARMLRACERKARAMIEARRADAPERARAEAEAMVSPLYDYLTRPYRNAWGRDMRISAIAIDSGGHFTHEVYAFVRSRCLPRLMAVKGASTAGRPILAPRPRPQDVTMRGRTIKRGVHLWMVGADTGKHWVHNRLSADAGVEPAERRLRFPADLDEDYYQQLLAEVFDPEKNRWVKRRGRRNEALDTAVYAVAASQHPEVRVHRKRRRDWDALARVLEPEDQAPAVEAEKTEKTEKEPEPKVRPRRRRAKKRGGFVTRWKGE